MSDQAQEGGQGSAQNAQSIIDGVIQGNQPPAAPEGKTVDFSQFDQVKNEAIQRRLENKSLKERLGEAEKIVEQFNALKAGQQSDLEKLQSTTADLTKQLTESTQMQEGLKAQLRITQLGAQVGVPAASLQFLNPNAFSADDGEAIEQLKALVPQKPQGSTSRQVAPGAGAGTASGISQEDMKSFLFGGNTNGIFGN